MSRPGAIDAARKMGEKIPHLHPTDADEPEHVASGRKLLRLRDLIRASEAFSADPAAEFFCAAVDALENGAPIEDAFRLRPATGRASAATVLQRSRRNEAIRQLGEFLGNSPGTAATIARMMVRFARPGGPWERSRGARACPSRFAGRAEAFLFAAFSARPAVLTERQVRSILDGFPQPDVRKNAPPANFRKVGVA